MSVWNKILLALIFIAFLGFFHAAARTVKTYQYWANLTYDFETKLKRTRAEIVSLRTADHEHPRDDKTVGVQQLRIDLGRVLANRGRIWTKCEKQKAEMDRAGSGIMRVSVSTDESATNAFTKNLLLYGFDEGDDQSPGKYLGEFRVEAVSEKQVVLASTTQMVNSLAKNVTESKGPWVFYELMPTDEHEAFANLTDEQKKWIEEDPKKWDSNEHIKDGQADANGKKFERSLRDYVAVFRTCEIYRTLFADRWAGAGRDLAYLGVARQEAESAEALAEKEKTQVGEELRRARKELAAVANLQAARQYMLKLYQTGVQAAIAKNLEYAQDIARLQKAAVDQIDSRMRTMAQFGPKAN